MMNEDMDNDPMKGRLALWANNRETILQNVNAIIAAKDAEIAALRQRAEDAELIAWGALRMDAPFLVLAEEYAEGFGEDEILLFVPAPEGRELLCSIGTLSKPAFTPESREALRKAKESANG